MESYQIQGSKICLRLEDRASCAYQTVDLTFGDFDDKFRWDVNITFHIHLMTASSAKCTRDS